LSHNQPMRSGKHTADESAPEPAAEPETGAGPQTDEEPLPSFSEQMAQQLGGVRGLVESSIPVFVFVLVNIVASLKPAMIAAVATAVVIGGYRLMRRESVRHAVNGLFGIFIGVAFAWKTGQARDFYLPGILLSVGNAALMLGSVVIRRPLVGWVWSVVVDGGSTRWRQERRLLRTFGWLTVLWAVVYLLKVSVQTGLYFANQVTALGVARLVLGYPPYLLLLAITVWAVRRTTHREPAPDLAPAPLTNRP
jgi:hypothetical protein